jgi:hypothetical protein
MAIVQISQVKNRSGLQQDLPQLATGEIGWSVDTQQVYIGNGTLAEGAPQIGNTRLLTTGDLLFANGQVLSQSIASGQANANIASCFFTNTQPGIIFNYSIQRNVGANNYVRTGTMHISQYNGLIGYDDEFSENAANSLSNFSTAIQFRVKNFSNVAVVQATDLSGGSITTAANLKYSLSSINF